MNEFIGADVIEAAVNSVRRIEAKLYAGEVRLWDVNADAPPGLAIAISNIDGRPDRVWLLTTTRVIPGADGRLPGWVIARKAWRAA